MTMQILSQRAIIRVSPTDQTEDAAAFLQGLLTNDVSGDLPCYAALLTPQGKTLFDMIVWKESANILLDCEAEYASELVKRLSLYRLRRKLEIARDETLGVFWNKDPFAGASPDPRLAALGFRAIVQIEPSQMQTSGEVEWLSHRLSLGIAERRAELGDILWLETNAVELNGVSFTKGCYIGQENTARMNWRGKINRRLLVVPLDLSQEKRQKAAFPELGLAVDHLKIADIPPDHIPKWLDLTPA